MLAAAAEAFCASDYFAVSVEDIAVAAGVSRMTFYRHFSGKAALALDLFRENVTAWRPLFLSIAGRDFRNRTEVAAWLADLFEADRNSGQLLRVFIQANAEESGFSQNAQAMIGELISDLGATIPAFALDADSASDRRCWMEAWLLIYEILDQSNHAARGSGVASNPLILDILAERFVKFVEAAQSR